MPSVKDQIIKVLEAILVYLKATNNENYQNNGVHNDALLEEVEDTLKKLKSNF